MDKLLDLVNLENQINYTLQLSVLIMKKSWWVQKTVLGVFRTL